VELATDIEGLVLRSLGVADLDRYAALVSRNKVHLASHGDYEDLVRAPADQLEADLSGDAVGRFGVWLDEDLIGRVDLIPKDGSSAVLAYWLDRNRLHSGFATVSCQALLSYGEAQLGISDVWAGVTHGNDASVALLERLGFAEVEDMGTYSRFHLDLRARARARSEPLVDVEIVRPEFARLYSAKAKVLHGSPIPVGAYGPVPMINGKGWMYRGGRGGNGLHESITGVRFNYPSPVHENGYVTYFKGSVVSVAPEFDRSWAAIYRADPLRFEEAFTQRLEPLLREWTRVKHLTTAFVDDDSPRTSLEIFLGVDEERRTLVYKADFWRTVDWYETFDPESLLIDRFVTEFGFMMEADLEQAGFTFFHDDRVHVDNSHPPSHVLKAIVDPSV
jgi:RimJ/RimL family protein N-acetyltransferase